jgi:hypothetical protein
MRPARPTRTAGRTAGDGGAPPSAHQRRALDVGGDATYTTAFEQLEVTRDPEPERRYRGDFTVRNRMDEDLWPVYQNALFRGGRGRA